MQVISTRWVALGALACVLSAQESAPLPAQPSTPETPAEIEGLVVSDSTGAPLRRARVVLHPLENGVPATGAEADDDGHFLLRDIPKGLYVLTAERDGYLTSTQALNGGQRMQPSLRIEPGQRLTNITFRLRPWAVLSGRVRYGDGEFGIGIQVQLYRTDHIRGRRAYSLADTVVANDRGEFRAYGLSPGAYLIAAVFDSPPTANYREQPMTDVQGNPLPAVGYTTTFYPNTELMSQAVPVRLAYGQELGGIDLTLRLSRKQKISGRVLNGITGMTLSGASITLSRVDSSGNGSLPAGSPAVFDRDNNFQISGVSPGSYGVFARGTADDGTVLTGHTIVVIGSDDVPGVALIANPAEDWPGRIVTEGPGVLPPDAAPRVTLEPRSMNAQVCTATPSARSGAALAFDCNLQRDEVYDVFADNLPFDFYLSAVRVGPADVKAIGLPGDAASQTPFEVVLDSRGGRVGGTVGGSDGTPWPGATLMLIPDPPSRRLQDYRSTSADSTGRFIFRGVAPGTYTLVGWLDQAPCDVYDSDGLDPCRAASAPVTVDAGIERDLTLAVRIGNQP